MARMYPRTLLAEEVKSKAEIKAFDALRDQLDDDWQVLLRWPAAGVDAITRA